MNLNDQECISLLEKDLSNFAVNILLKNDELFTKLMSTDDKIEYYVIVSDDYDNDLISIQVTFNVYRYFFDLINKKSNPVNNMFVHNFHIHDNFYFNYSYTEKNKITNHIALIRLLENSRVDYLKIYMLYQYDEEYKDLYFKVLHKALAHNTLYSL